MRCAADDLEHLLAAHEPVLGQVDDAHAAAAQLAEDLVVGMVGQARGQACWPAAARPGTCESPPSFDNPASEEPTGGDDSGRPVRLAEPAEEAVGRHLGDPAPARSRTPPGACSTASAQHVVELAQAIGLQGLVGRMHGGWGVHRGLLQDLRAIEVSSDRTG